MWGVELFHPRQGKQVTPCPWRGKRVLPHNTHAAAPRFRFRFPVPQSSLPPFPRPRRTASVPLLRSFPPSYRSAYHNSFFLSLFLSISHHATAPFRHPSRASPPSVRSPFLSSVTISAPFRHPPFPPQPSPPSVPPLLCGGVSTPPVPPLPISPTSKAIPYPWRSRHILHPQPFAPGSDRPPSPHRPPSSSARSHTRTPPHLLLSPLAHRSKNI